MGILDGPALYGLYRKNKKQRSKKMNMDQVKQFIFDKTRKNGQIFQDQLPTSTKEGKYQFDEWGTWVGSFWTGLNFLCYEMSQDESYLEVARKSRHRFKRRLYERPETLDHDIGFLYSLSCVADYKLTGNEEAKKIALDAAKVLKERFREKGQYIQAWNVWNPGDLYSEGNRGRMIVDCMYNLPILFWAAEQTGDQSYYKVAVAHADTTAKYLVREDYTAYHTFVFDPVTGEPKYGETHQGYGDDSCWARGQAWLIGGFAHAYKYTKEEKYLEIAKKVADVFLARLEEDFIPMWDFTLPNKEGEPRDASAASIAAASLLELSQHLAGEEKQHYQQWSYKILESLYENYSTKDEPNNQGLILHACGHRPASKDLDCSLIYGDYYFAEGIARLLEATKTYW